MKLRKFIAPFLLIVILITFNHLFLGSYNNIRDGLPDIFSIDEQVQPDTLFKKVWNIIQKDYYDTTLNHQDWQRWKTHYSGKIHSYDDAKVAIDTMLASLDEPYTRFMPEKEFSDLTTSINSKIYGIGVNIYSNSGKIEIFNVIPSTPADFAQLKQGDIIISVDQKDTSGMNISEVANMVRGAENTVVELTILRNNTKIVKKIVRKEIKIKNVKSRVLDKHIAYIQILSFMGNSTAKEFLEALDNTKNTDSIIIDLRGNTGGLLDNAVFIANMFIENGNIVEIIYRNNNKKIISANSSQKALKKPVVILVNGASASASEIFSGALKDCKRATLVGRKTFGKGLVQKVVPLPNNTGLNVTIAKYLTPNGTDINKLGIKPDIEVGNEFDLFVENSTKDIQLETAKNTLNQTLLNFGKK